MMFAKGYFVMNKNIADIPMAHEEQLQAAALQSSWRTIHTSSVIYIIVFVMKFSLVTPDYDPDLFTETHSSL